MMEATFGLLQCFCSHSPPAAAPPPPVHLRSLPSYQQVFQRAHQQSPICHYGFPQPPLATLTPQIRNGTKQSMAARERRRKIAAKTQELGKLIPGAHKMNTAQMLQAASKYVKFLQAQLALLHQIHKIIPSSSTNGGGYPMEALSVLLASSAVQQKLYSQDKCLAPKQLLHHLSTPS